MGGVMRSGSGEEDAPRLALPVRIEVVQGDAPSRSLEYAGERPLLIGRDPACDIVLTTKKASRRHARLVVEDGRLLVRDDESANGTYLNDVQVVEAELRPGDVVLVGGARITVEAGATTTSAPPSPILQADSTPDAAGPPPAREDPRAMLVRPTARTRGKGWLSSALTAAAWLFIVAVGCIVTLEVLRNSPRGSPGTPAGAPTAASPVQVMAPATPAVTTTANPEPQPPAVIQPPGLEAPQSEVETSRNEEQAAKAALDELLRKAQGSDLGWDVMSELEAVLAAYPPGAARAEVERLAGVLRGTRASAAKAWRRRAASLVDEMLQQERYGEAAAAARFLARAELAGDEREHWQARAEEIEGKALARFRALEAELSALNEKGKAAEALQALVSHWDRFAGAEFFGAVLPPYVNGAVAPSPPTESSLTTPRALAMKARARVAFDASAYGELEPMYQALLALEPPPAERFRLLESLVESFYLDRMLKDCLASLARGPIEVSLVDGHEGRVLGADAKELEYELDVDGRRGSFRGSRPWQRLPPARKVAVFEAATLSDEGLLGLAFLLFHTGDEEGAQRMLLRLWKRKSSQELASAVLARHLGIALPEEGFVELEGRLVTVEARAAELERRRRAAEEDKAARAELARAKRDARIEGFLDVARRLRQQGAFTVAQDLLEEIARRFPKTQEGKTAVAMLKDPVLQVHTLLDNGSRNRLDFFILGDGYPAQDDYQAAFLVSARLAMKLLLKEEPYREYASYVNFHAVQLASKDRGLDRMPGGTDKDTACGGKVEWDVFTADRSKVSGILKRLGRRSPSVQAIVIGNDAAGVSTGGGGVSCVARGSLDALAHEVGHALGGLRDEYDYEPGHDPARSNVQKRAADVPVSALPPNLMAGSNREDVLRQASWKGWIDAGEARWWNGSKVAVFEGGDRTPFNVWRPQSSCKMRDSSAFCVVCMEVMVKSLYARVRPIDRVEPDREEITLPSGEEREVKVWPMKPATHFLEARWSLQRLADEEKPKKGATVVVKKHAEQVLKTVYRHTSPDGRPVEAALLRATDFGEGKRFRLRVEVRDPTMWVFRDEGKLLEQSREWVVRILGKE